MPGQAGSATAPGQKRQSASNSALEIGGASSIVPIGGVITSDELRMIALPGLSVNIDRTGILAGAAVAVTVQVRVQSDTSPWITLAIPCCCDPAVLDAIPAGGKAFVSWDHLAVRQARVVLTAPVGTDTGPVLLMGAAT